MWLDRQATQNKNVKISSGGSAGISAKFAPEKFAVIENPMFQTTFLIFISVGGSYYGHTRFITQIWPSEVELLSLLG